MSNEKYYEKLYKEINSIIGDKTPLKADCGKVCGGACCKGDENTGMILFPFEKSELKITQKDSVRLAVCEGECDRNNRPLSCRIFPFFPYVTPEGKIRVIPDIRGVNVCPLISRFDEVKFHRGFLWRVKKAGRLMLKDELCREFLEGTSREIDSFLSLLE